MKLRLSRLSEMIRLTSMSMERGDCCVWLIKMDIMSAILQDDLLAIRRQFEEFSLPRLPAIIVTVRSRPKR